MRNFDRDVQVPGIAFKEATRESPDYLTQTLAIVPLSMGVGFVVLIGAGLICWGLQESARSALVVGGLVMCVCALYAFWRVWDDRIYMAIESITGHDWNQDGFVGEPPPPRTVTIEITNPNNNNLQFLQIPEPLFDKLPMIAYLLRAGKPFSEGAMCGSGRPLSRSEFHQLRDVMFDRGLATWRNPDHPTLGVILTAHGQSVMRRAEELSTTPPRMSTQGSAKVLPANTGAGEWGDGYD
jgi:hypothetical protein